MKDLLLDEALAKPVGKAVSKADSPKDFTRKIERNGDTVTAIINAEPDTVDESTASQYLEQQGLDPAEWQATGFKRSVWGGPESPMESCSFTFKRVAATPQLDISELIASLEPYESPAARERSGTSGYVVLIGDVQIGKIDGDGVAGTWERAITAINLAADRYVETYRNWYDADPVHIAWLGDHIEGFNSQGGTNAWRTQLPLTEQIRLTRRIMLYALTTFAPLTSHLTMAAVPGNHGEAVRFGGKGITRYDDSHDTESLIAVADAAKLSGKFEHVEFFVPQTDELTVIVEVANTVIAHAHGHQWRPGKAMEWWQGQAFSPKSQLDKADILVAGHLHHEHVIGEGGRLFVQVPSLESESTWWKHSKGTSGDPGIIVGLVEDGRFPIRETIHLGGEK